MQTLELGVVRKNILESFLFLHFQPPGFDLLRLILASPELLIGFEPSSRNLDLRLYIFYALLFGLMNGTLFYWAQRLSHSNGFALAAVVLWSMYPGNIAMVTYLDSMYLSTVLLTLTLHFWMLWYMSSDAKFAVASAITGIGATLVRTSLQPTMFLLAMVAGSVVLLLRMGRMNLRRIVTLLVVCIALLAALPVKQLVLFGTFSTTSSSGHHLLGMIRYQPTEEELQAISVPAAILKNATTFENKFNKSEEVITNYKYSKIFVSQITSDPVRSVKESLVTARRSVIKGAGATQDFKPNVLAQSLPWSEVSSQLFSGFSYAVFISAGWAGLLVVKRRAIVLKLIVAGIPPLVVIASVLFAVVFGSLRYTEAIEMGQAFGWTDGFTWTESNRVKFLIEPVLFWTASVGLLLVVGRVRQALLRRYRPSLRNFV